MVNLARRGLLTQAQQDEMTARYRDWLDSCRNVSRSLSNLQFTLLALTGMG
ncbi:MAG: hypothetical protein ACLRP3_10360 [Escherichia sp.]